jgi:hypothetical protein
MDRVFFEGEWTGPARRTDRRGAMTEQPVDLRTVRVLALVGWALAAGALLVALVVEEGQARGHAFFHLAFAVVALAGITGVAFAPRGAGRG